MDPLCNRSASDCTQPGRPNSRQAYLVHRAMTQAYSIYLCVCVCVKTLMISLLDDWLADGVDLPDSAVCQAGPASTPDNMSEGADN